MHIDTPEGCRDAKERIQKVAGKQNRGWENENENEMNEFSKHVGGGKWYLYNLSEGSQIIK